MFTSGDYYHLATGDWGSHQVPFSSFNIGHRGDTPLLLGRALMTQQDTVMTAYNQIFQLDKVEISVANRSIGSTIGRTNHSKSGPNEPTFFSWVWVHALMAVRTLILSLVKYLCDAVDFCETAQLPLGSLSVEKLWVSNFILQSLIDPKPCPFFPGHTLWATFRVIHALHILPWSNFPRPLTNRSRQSRFQHWQWSRRILSCGARILKILIPKTMYILWETCLPHE